MHINTYRNLHQALLDDIDIDEFVFIRKIKKRMKLAKVYLALSYAMLISSLWFASTEVGFALIVSGLVLILYFRDRIKHYTDLISNNKLLFEEIMNPYVDSNNLIEFRKLQLSKLKDGAISKMDYLSIVKEEISLLLSLVRKECIEDSSINIVTYKNSIENLFDTLSSAAKSNLIDSHELSSIKRKWTSDLQVLCNQYAKTDTEVELKYLYSKIKDAN